MPTLIRLNYLTPSLPDNCRLQLIVVYLSTNIDPFNKLKIMDKVDYYRLLQHSDGLREPSFWSSKVNERGEIFHLELASGTSECCGEKDVCAHVDKECLCICSDCATDDTGYGTDTDVTNRRDGEDILQSNCQRLISDFSESEAPLWPSDFSVDRDSRGINFRQVEENIDNLFASNNHYEKLDVCGTEAFEYAMPDNIDSYFQSSCQIEDVVIDSNIDNLFSKQFSSNKAQYEISTPVIDPSRPSVCQCRSKSDSDKFTMDEQKLVVLRLKPLRSKAPCSGAVELCEKVLGIVPGHYGSSKSRKDSRHGHRVKVRGIVPIGLASKHPEIHVGDWLKSINGQAVTWDNLNGILQSLLHQKQATLLLEKVVRQSEKPVVLVKKTHIDRMVQLVTGSQDATVSSITTDVEGEPFYSVMYLSLDGLSSETMQDKEDVLYQFPRCDSKVVSVRGLNITLAGTLRDATESIVHSSVLDCGGTMVNVAYHSEGSNLLLMSVPESRMSLFSLQSLVSDIVRLLQVLYGSVHDALQSPSNQKQLDCFFSLLHHSYISQSKTVDTVQPRSHSLGHSVQVLNLPHDIKMSIDRTLTDYEAADFGDMSDSYYGCRRGYSILGSCLFYKNDLVCNHLPREDLVDVSLYLRHHALLSLAADQTLSQLVMWREVYPTRHCHTVGEEQTFGYSEPAVARWFWLVIGYKHMLICVMLETGGCTAVKTGVSPPDPFLIDQTRAVLMQLEFHSVQTQCQSSINHPEGPVIIHPDQVCLQKGKPDLFQKLLKKSPARESNNQIHIDPDSSHNASVIRRARHTRKFSLGSDASSDSGSSDHYFKMARKGRLFPEMSDSFQNFQEQGGLINRSRKLTAGADNCLFHYQYFDNLEGVFISSSQDAAESPMNREVAENFHRCCRKIKTMFDIARQRKEQRKDGRDHVFGINEDLTSIREEGVVFQTTPPDEKTLPLTYWVVGRCLSRSMRREVYVCFLDSTPQTAIELAFKLILGCLP